MNQAPPAAPPARPSQKRPLSSRTEQMRQTRMFGIIGMLFILGPFAVIAGAIELALANAMINKQRAQTYLSVGGGIGFLVLMIFFSTLKSEFAAIPAIMRAFTPPKPPTVQSSAATAIAKPAFGTGATPTPIQWDKIRSQTPVPIGSIKPTPLIGTGKDSSSTPSKTSAATTRLMNASVAIFPILLRIWVQMTMLGPMVAMFLESSRVKQVDELERERRTREEKKRQDIANQARTIAGKSPPIAEKEMVMGIPIDGDLSWLKANNTYFTYPAPILNRHLVVIGGSGTGKTETSLRLAYGAAKAYGWKVLYLDCKGDEEMALRFRDAMIAAGKTKIGLFPDQAYSGWRGDATAIFNRLMTIVDYSEPYYRDMTKMILDLAVNAPATPKGPSVPPRSSTELLYRLNLNHLAELYGDHPDPLIAQSGEAIRGINEEHVHSAHNRYRAFYRALDGGLDGDWAFEDMDAAYILLRGLELKDQTASIGRFMMEDFAHFVSKRKPANDKVLFIIDEFPAIAFGGANAATLFEMVRSKGAGVVVTAQSYAGMGDGVDRILGAASSLLLHQCADPDKILPRAGIQINYMRSVQFAERGVSQNPKALAVGEGSIREKEDFKVHPNEVKTLTPGECFMISGGQYQRIVVARLSPDIFKKKDEPKSPIIEEIDRGQRTRLTEKTNPAPTTSQPVEQIDVPVEETTSPTIELDPRMLHEEPEQTKPELAGKEDHAGISDESEAQPEAPANPDLQSASTLDPESTPNAIQPVQPIAAEPIEKSVEQTDLHTTEPPAAASSQNAAEVETPPEEPHKPATISATSLRDDD